jgi:hypothetical protein
MIEHWQHIFANPIAGTANSPGNEMEGANAVNRIADLPRAQKMMDDLLKRKWERMLTALARRVNPLPSKLDLYGYYWWKRRSNRGPRT